MIESTQSETTGSPPNAPSTRTSIEDLFTSSYDDMLRLAFVLLRNQSDAEEVVQDAFLDLQARWLSVLNPPGYLRTTVVNGARRRLTRSANRDRILRTTLHHDPVVVVSETEYLLDVLDTLSERHRTAVILAYYLRLTPAEIAEILGCRPGTAKSLVHRGLKRLRKELTDHA